MKVLLYIVAVSTLVFLGILGFGLLTGGLANMGMAVLPLLGLGALSTVLTLLVGITLLKKARKKKTGDQGLAMGGIAIGAFGLLSLAALMIFDFS